MKLGNVRKSGRLCGAVTAVVATLTVMASVSWVAQTASAVQPSPTWVSPPPQQVHRDHTFVVSTGPGASLHWAGRGASCWATSDFTAECRVGQRARGGVVFTATDQAGRDLTATTRVVLAP